MAMDNDSAWMHNELYKKIGDEIPIGSQDFNSLRHFIPLSDRDKAENSGSVEDLLTKWEKRGGISPGNYDPLLKLLRQTQLIKVLSIAKAQVDAIKIQLDTEERKKASTAVESPAPSPLDAEEREGASTAVESPAPPKYSPSSDATLVSCDDPTKVSVVRPTRRPKRKTSQEHHTCHGSVKRERREPSPTT